MAVIALYFDRFISVKEDPEHSKRQPEPVLTCLREEKNPLSFSEI
jgi:hypothetical protein